VTLDGQTLIGPPCAWCGSAAEGEIEVDPQRKGTKRRGWADARPARKLPACGAHLNGLQTGELVKRPRESKRPIEGQLGLELE
jgi:hypothetical protein